MNQHFDAIIIGSGMGSLSAACLLAKEGLKVAVLEQNYLPGGCTSSYWRKGFVFESGATTLVGLDPQMPLRYLLDRIGVQLDAVELELPMQVHLADGTTIQKYKSLDKWIEEAEKKFGAKNQRSFWQFCYRISRFVWETSLRQTAFPPTTPGDLWQSARHVTATQLRYAPYALMSMRSLLKKYDLLDNELFTRFVNEQLLITAQNHIDEVNVLFGATALCYTNYGNYYVNGGLINLVTPLVEYLEKQGSAVFLRHKVENIVYKNGKYVAHCGLRNKVEKTFESRFLVSGIPINNTLQLYSGDFSRKYDRRLMNSTQLNSAFQLGIGFVPHREFDSIHHQVHLPAPLPEIGSASIFVSLSHPADLSRTDQSGLAVASVSTHIHDPAARITFDKSTVETAILNALETHNLVKKENIVYFHSSVPQAWEKWTMRQYGFVGGYPQYMHIKPWQMLDARLDGKGAYLCGDTAYPGQGIPGTVLSGIIAVEKLKRDHL